MNAKSKYVAPALEVEATQPVSIIAESLGVNNSATDGLQGDAKEWAEDIWGEGSDDDNSIW